jgi:hypothetical protein
MTPASLTPFQKPLSGESEQVAVRGSAIWTRLKLPAYLIRGEKSSGAIKNRQNFRFRHGSCLTCSKDEDRRALVLVIIC